ncbi:PEP-CTERM sorting domain-containing protein [Nitrosococcus wardiae]|uniref:PEP-CTERM sorting domain-containing protein n=1 Tax=Nitrosococcus wardiae TaxID=1814290 RepID=A0A4P7BZX9_9GAMM|nr:PEP-CTERM sorting domain-containing protein [Nitrosococcus wardiae]QBQ55813.1 PEP-CTERM sorting domain-containing protein [Nitrosococcus wardiae]
MPTNFLRWLRMILAMMLGATLIALGTVNETQATVLIAPNALATEEGNANNAAPFTFSSRYQQVFEASEFSSLSGLALITKISFRPDAVFGQAFSATIPNIQISFSTTSAVPDELNPIFSNNTGSDNRLVFSGSLFLSSAFTGPAAGPKDFDVSVNLQNSFLYNPDDGNLLLDVKNFANNFSVAAFDAHNLVGDSLSRVWNDSDVNSDTAFFGSGNPNDFSNSLGLVTQFTFTPVTEPATLALFSIGVLSLLGWRRNLTA